MATKPRIHHFEITSGIMIYLADTSTTPSRVLDVREPSDAFAEAHGGLTIDVETYSTSHNAWLPDTLTVWPDQTFRLEDNPKVVAVYVAATGG